MRNKTFPFENLVKCAILSGRESFWIEQTFVEFGISLCKADIEFTSVKIRKLNAVEIIITENTRRITDGEEVFIDEDAVKIVFSKFADDAVSLINSFYEHDNIEDFTLEKTHFLNYLKYPKLLTKVLNTLLVFGHSSVLGNVFLLDESLCENQEIVSQSELEKFQFFIFNTLSYTQFEISQSLKNEKYFKNINIVNDLLNDNSYDFLHHPEPEKLIVINENRSIFKLLLDLEQFLNNKINRFHSIVNSLKIKISSWQNMLKKIPVNFIYRISKPDYYPVLDYSESKKSSNRSLFVPFLNLIKLLLYSGFELDEIKSFFDATWHNNIPIQRYQQILEECQASQLGRDLIAETRNRKKKKKYKPRIISNKLGNHFQFPEIFHTYINTDIKLCLDSILPFESLDLQNKEIAQIIETFLTGNADIKRIIECLKEEFYVDISEYDIKLFQYFWWNLETLDSPENIIAGFYDYFYLDHDNEWFEPHQNVLLRGLNHTLYTLDLINVEEIAVYFDDMLTKLRSDASKSAKTRLKIFQIIDRFTNVFKMNSHSKLALMHINEAKIILQIALGIDKDDEYILSHKKEKIPETAGTDEP